jgi:hypothetical protein
LFDDLTNRQGFRQSHHAIDQGVGCSQTRFAQGRAEAVVDRVVILERRTGDIEND